MWDRVSDVLTSNQHVWTSDEAVCSAAFRFRLLRNEIIEVTRAASGIETTGREPVVIVASTDAVPLDSNAAREAAIAVALPIADAVRRWAEHTDNDAIARNVDLGADGLRDTLTADRLRLLHTIGVSNMGELARYGVAQPALDDLMEKIRAFEAVNPRTIANQADVGGGEAGGFDEIIRDGMALLNDTLDPAVERHSATSPDFVDAYKAARSGMDTVPSEEPPANYKL